MKAMKQPFESFQELAPPRAMWAHLRPRLRHARRFSEVRVSEERLHEFLQAPVLLRNAAEHHVFEPKSLRNPPKLLCFAVFLGVFGWF